MPKKDMPPGLDKVWDNLPSQAQEVLSDVFDVPSDHDLPKEIPDGDGSNDNTDDGYPEDSKTQ